MIETFFSSLEQLPIAVTIAENGWYFPLIESVHVMALAVVFGSISMLDLRLLGVRLADRDVADLTREILPWTWVAFVVAAITGSLLFASAATRYMYLWPLQLKMLLLLAAGINMLVFHFLPYRSVARWGKNPVPPLAARLAGGISLVLWIGVVAAGRLIGFM
jgi:hypothetical protein